jgi:AraC-like DNA-binding protein
LLSAPAYIAQRQSNIFSSKTASFSFSHRAVEDAFLQQVRAIVEEHYADEGFSLPQLCQKVGMSRSQLYRKLKAVSGLSPDMQRIYQSMQPID